MDDQRFAHVGRDPKFRSMPKKYKKVKIDERFDAMFKDNRFKLKYTVDKRGRPVNFSSSEDLKRYYEAEEDSGDSAVAGEEGASESEGEVDGLNRSSPAQGGSADSGDSDRLSDDAGDVTSPPAKVKPADTPKVKKTTKAASKKPKLPAAKPTSASPDDHPADKQPQKKSKKKLKRKKLPLAEAPEEAPVREDVRQRLMDLAVDYARGGGVLMEDSSSDDESEPEEVGVEHDWAELDRDAPRIPDEETTARLALCNMDWDRIRAEDIMVLLSSFLPPGGVISEVAIYQSEFGKQRMAEEEERGPPELFDAKERQEDDSSEEEDAEPKTATDSTPLSQAEYIRRYQLSRLRYYYAVVGCDSRHTAGRLYDECEGLEFESSASRVDLRFIPEGMTFEEAPRDRCTSVPEPGRYRPSQFVTTALQQRRVRLTWDETDAARQEAVRRAVAQGGRGEDADIRAYLADSGSEEERSDEDAASGEEEDGKEDERTRIAKYRALLLEGDEDQQEKPSGDVEMEITWGGVDLKEKTEELVRKKEQGKDFTPWEKYIEKQKTKKRAKSAAQKEAAKEASSSEDSDSDIPSDLAEDPFFKEELDARRAEGNKQKKKKAGKGGKEEVEEPDEDDKARLALLTMDDGAEDGRRHFDFKQIVKDETAPAGKKKRWKKKRKPAAEEARPPADDFKVDVSDPRFSQLFDSAEFNVDPSDARYRATEGMRRLVGEKQRRVAQAGDRWRQTETAEESTPKKARLATAPVPAPATEDLGALVSSIKSKTKHLNKKKAKSSR